MATRSRITTASRNASNPIQAVRVAKVAADMLYAEGFSCGDVLAMLGPKPLPEVFLLITAVRAFVVAVNWLADCGFTRDDMRALVRDQWNDPAIQVAA